jgi:hypothetical protein
MSGFRITLRVSGSDRGHWFARLVPYPLRRLHHWHAATFGYFWLPCPVCGNEFGGHEWRRVDGRPDSIHLPGDPSSTRTGICPRCTRAGRGEPA